MEASPQPNPGLPAVRESSRREDDHPGLFQSAAAFVSARAELIRLEARAAARQAGIRGAQAAGVLVCAFFGWALLLAAAVGLFASWLGWPWFVIALILAVLHAVVAAVLGFAVVRAGPPTFEFTRAELEKDRQWLANLKHELKSKR